VPEPASRAFGTLEGLLRGGSQLQCGLDFPAGSCLWQEGSHLGRYRGRSGKSERDTRPV